MNETSQGELDLGSHKDGTDIPAGSSVAASGQRKPENWLGLVTTHRRLFEASQSGWLHPSAGTNFRLGQRDYVSEDLSAGRNVIPVRLAFDVEKLPFRIAHDPKDETGLCGEGADRQVVQWNAPIPLYATTRLEVTSAERRSHLLAMAGRLDNFILPVEEVDIVDFPEPSPPYAPSTTEDDITSTELPPTLNAVQGAMAMAVWGIPRIRPWVTLLRNAFSQKASEVSLEVERLGVPWFQFPWLRQEDAPTATDELASQARLWKAALTVLQSSSAESKSALKCAELMAQQAGAGDGDQSLESWLAQTRRLLDADEQISCDRRGQGGAGLAVQLVLLRPEPAMFKTWARDLPDLSPSVWWAASILCGWRFGYQNLGRGFRGDRELNEAIATRALLLSMEVDIPDALPHRHRAPIEVAPKGDGFTLTWRGATLLRKQWHSRGKWYNADLSDKVSERAARDMARQMGWRTCINQDLHFPEGRHKAPGIKTLLIDGEYVIAKTDTSVRLPANSRFCESIDQDEFRRLLATGYGIVPDVPANVSQSWEIEPNVVPEQPMVSRRCEIQDVPGLVYLPDFISEDEERSLVDQLDQAEWSDDIKRRVQQYGWRYDYSKRMVDDSARIGDLPEWAMDLARRLQEQRLVPVLPDQLIVNEYRKNQGISKHIDKTDDFAEHIATISLLETWEMNFRRGTKTKVPIPLERRSVAIMSGDARYRWSHEIPVRKSEPSHGGAGKGRIDRDRRISLTFRTVNRQK